MNVEGSWLTRGMFHASFVHSLCTYKYLQRCKVKEKQFLVVHLILSHSAAKGTVTILLKLLYFCYIFSSHHIILSYSPNFLILAELSFL